MFDSIKKIAIIRLALRYVKAHERIADALDDIRAEYCGNAIIAINRDDPDESGVEVSFSTDADTFEREVEESRRYGSQGRGKGQPFGI